MAYLSYLRGRSRLLQEVRPYLSLRFSAQRLILDAKMYTALYGLVKCRNTIRRENHDTLKVLQQAQENRDEGIMRQMLGLTSFEKHIRFVEQEDSFPASDKIKNCCEAYFELVGVEAKITCTDAIERSTLEL